MFTFLRKIRRSLIDSGSVPKYIIYAISEIALVVIGILIALQVNNWNEYRKLRAEENKMLFELRQSLQTDIDHVITPFMGRMENDVGRINVLLNFIESGEPYQDSLDSYFGVLSRGVSFHYRISAYRSLESKGIDLITDDEIKNEIMQLYNFRYIQVDNRIGNAYNNIREYGRPIIRHQCKRIPAGGHRPLDFETLRENASLWNILHTLRSNFNELNKILADARDAINQLVAKIDEKLGTIN